MKSKTNCPQCNSLQSFGRRRDRWEVDGIKKVREFVQCTMCSWQVILFEGSEEEHKIRRDIDKLKSAALRGIPSQRRLGDRQKSLAHATAH